MLEDQDIKNIVEAAFKPLQCKVAEIKDYGENLMGFRVFDENHEIVLESEPVGFNRIRDEQDLKNFLLDGRQRLKAKGFALAQWTFP